MKDRTSTRPGWSLSWPCTSVAWGLGFTILIGCATPGERAARTNWDDARTVVVAPRPAEPASTAPEIPEIVTLPQALSHAEANNPGLRAAFERWTAALESVPQVTALPEPRISYAYFLTPVETRVGPQRQRVGVSQTIPLFGKLGLRGEVAVQNANAAGARFESTRRALRSRVARQWNEVYYLGRAIAITEENTQLLQNLEEVALSQYAAGRAPHSTVIRAQVEVGRLEDRLRTLRDRRQPLVAALNAELNRSEGAPIDWPSTPATGTVLLLPEEMRDALMAHNPDLAAARYREERDAVASRLAGRSRWPDLSLGIEFIQTDEARSPGVTDSGQDAAMATAAINVPLWLGKNAAERSQAAAERSASHHDAVQLRNQLLAALEESQFQLRDAERRVELYSFTLLPKARQSLGVTEDAFITGEAGFLDLIDAQRTLLEFELAHERARVDLANHRIELEEIVGADLSTGGRQ